MGLRWLVLISLVLNYGSASNDVPDALHDGDRLCVIYQTNAEPVRMHLRLDTNQNMILQVARHFQLHHADVVALWEVAAPLQGEVEDARAFILQKVGDLPYGSPARLIILDYQVHGFEDVVTVPDVTRMVKQVNPSLNRYHLLLLAKVQEYCRQQQDRCLVFADNRIWMTQDRANRNIDHGFYGRIVLPAPLVQACQDVDTQEAINRAQMSVEPFSNESVQSDDSPRWPPMWPPMSPADDSDSEPGFDPNDSDGFGDSSAMIQVSQKQARMMWQFFVPAWDCRGDVPDDFESHPSQIDTTSPVLFQMIRQQWNIHVEAGRLDEDLSATFLTFYLTPDWRNTCVDGRRVSLPPQSATWLDIG